MRVNEGKTVSVVDQGKVAKLLGKLKKADLKEATATPQDLRYAVKLIEHLQELQDTGGHTAKFFLPNTPLSIEHYPKHKAFFDATATHKEVLFRASNRAGKSVSGAYAATCWLTGIYPAWWQGRVFDKATYGWVCGDTNDTVRTILQKELLGSPRGTGMIPKRLIEEVVVRPGTGGTVDTIYVRHEPTGKLSTAKFKTYQQGAESFYGAAPDWGWMDEEPSGRDAMLIWNQMYVRLLTTNGTLIITFTPLLGWTPLLKNFCETADDVTPE